MKRTGTIFPFNISFAQDDAGTSGSQFSTASASEVPLTLIRLSGRVWRVHSGPTRDQDTWEPCRTTVAKRPLKDVDISNLEEGMKIRLGRRCTFTLISLLSLFGEPRAHVFVGYIAVGVLG